MYALIRSILFLLPAEKAHHFAGFFVQISGNWPFRPLVRFFFKYPSKPFKCMDLVFPSRIGLAAGFDKDATMFKGLGALGFGFVEVGTVTPKAQPGNPAPRLFRLKADNALINRMGFNNKGLDHMLHRLRARDNYGVIGGNIGKNKVTPNEEAVHDYTASFKTLFPYVDYFTVNVSSPNTPGLRELQDKEPLLRILNALQKLNMEMEQPKPILLKIAPDLNEAQLDDIAFIVKESGIAGVIATNTTIERGGLKTPDPEVKAVGAGGLSGLPLRERSKEVVRYLAKKSGKSFVIIGVGGIFNGKDAVEMLKAGADLVQIYTSFIYKGPSLLKEIKKEIDQYENAS